MLSENEKNKIKPILEDNDIGEVIQRETFLPMKSWVSCGWNGSKYHVWQ